MARTYAVTCTLLTDHRTYPYGNGPVTEIRVNDWTFSWNRLETAEYRDQYGTLDFDTFCREVVIPRSLHIIDDPEIRPWETAAAEKADD